MSRDLVVPGGDLFPGGVIATVDEAPRRSTRGSAPKRAAVQGKRRAAAEAEAAELLPRAGALAVDPDAPCCTTADGLNPWPRRWWELQQAGARLTAGEREGARRWAAKLESEAMRRGDAIF